MPVIFVCCTLPKNQFISDQPPSVCNK